QALDLGSLDQSWRYLDMASRAAATAGDLGLWAFSRVEQAQVLLDLERPKQAAALATSVWRDAQSRVVPAMRCWLAAAAAEMVARAGDEAASLDLMRVAESTSDALGGDLPPYLVFNRVHLDRWIGHTLTLMGDRAAIERLRAAAEE